MFLKYIQMQLISWYGFIATECTNTNSIKHQYELRLSLSTYDYIEVIFMIQFVWQIRS